MDGHIIQLWRKPHKQRLGDNKTAMHTFLTLIALILPFVAGLGFISFYWVGLSALAAYLDGILVAGEQIGGDFRTLESEEFMGKQKFINKAVFGSFMIMAIIYGIGRLIAWVIL